MNTEGTAIDKPTAKDFHKIVKKSRDADERVAELEKRMTELEGVKK